MVSELVAGRSAGVRHMNVLSGAAILADVAYAQTYSTVPEAVALFSGVDDTDQPGALLVPRGSEGPVALNSSADDYGPSGAVEIR